MNAEMAPWQTGFAVAAIETLTGSNGLTTIVITFEVEGFPVTQEPGIFDVNITWTTSPLDGWYVNIGPDGPVLAPLTFHWNDGDDPPFTAVAVKVTGVPVQMLLDGAEIVTLTGLPVLTVTP